MDSTLLFGFILLGCSIGFTRPALFITVGYGMAIAGIGIGLMLLMGLYLQRQELTYTGILLLIQSIMYIIYGLRLSGHIYYRETYSDFKKDPAHKMELNIAFPSTLFMWLSVSLLYYSYALPSLIGIRALKLNEYQNGYFHTIGLIIMGIGFFFESIGDYQKWASKKHNPSMYCKTGLYRLSRMPNYFGELAFWVGNYITCLGHTKSGFQIILSSLGSLFSIWLMIMASARLDHSQYERYKDQSEYIKYRETVPILIPFIPIYSLRMSSKTEFNVCFPSLTTWRRITCLFSFLFIFSFLDKRLTFQLFKQ